MALDKTDLLFKKVFSGTSITSTSKQYYEEGFVGKPLSLGSQIWLESGSIPSTAPTLSDQETSGVVKYWNKKVLTAVAGTSDQAFQHNDLKNTIPFNFDPDGSYAFSLYRNDDTEIPLGQSNWTFDVETGTLFFHDEEPQENSPVSGMGPVNAANPPKISVYQYIGKTLNISGIGSENQILKVSGSNLVWDDEPADVTGITTGTGLSGTNLSGPVPVLNVGGGDGIIANANDIEVAVDDETIELSTDDGNGVVKAKIAAVADSGTALATGDQIHTFVTSQGYLSTGNVAINDLIGITSLDTDLDVVSATHDTLVSAKSVKDYVDSSGGGSYQSLSGIVALNNSTAGDEVLSGDHTYLHNEELTISIDDELTINDTKILNIDEIAKTFDPTPLNDELFDHFYIMTNLNSNINAEKFRINERRVMDVDIRQELAQLNNKFDWLKVSGLFYIGAKLNQLATYCINSQVVGSGHNHAGTGGVKWVEAPIIGGDWTFNTTHNAWVAEEAHGLSVQDRVSFKTFGTAPLEFEGNRKIYWVEAVDVSGLSHSIRLKGTQDGAYIESSDESEGDWTLVNVNTGYLAYQHFENIDWSMAYPLVENETYTESGGIHYSGVCSIPTHTNETTCVRAGGTWYQ